MLTMTLTSSIVMTAWRCWLIVMIGVLVYPTCSTDDVDCCELVPQPRLECRHACNLLSASGSLASRGFMEPGSVRQTIDLTNLNRMFTLCPRTMVNLWSCINSSIPHTAKAATSDWWGLPCCEMSLTSQCRNVCRKARSRDDLNEACSDNDERAVFVCLDRYERGQQCCYSSSLSLHCGAVCKAIFIQDTRPTRAQLAAVESHCDRRVATCLHNYTNSAFLSNPVDSLPCCEHASSPTCRSRCRSALSSLSTDVQIVEELSQFCGVPDPSVSLWQCFLQSSTNTVRHRYNHGGNMDITGIDSVMLQCCSKANTLRCRELCQRTYSKDWTETVQDFHRQCTGYQPHETNLHACLQDVEERCQIGCKGLEFCSNFNHRPSEMFRSCTRQADESARNAFRSWETGIISLPMLIPLDIFVKNIRTCQSAKWRAVACALHVKPCHSGAKTTSICRSDCVSLLNECLSHESMASAEEICAKLAPLNDPATCISISTYTSGSQHKPQQKDITSPCNANPCNSSQICEVVRRQCASRHTCPNYVCRPGCPLGEVVTQLVPHNTYVRIPKASLSSGRSKGPCYQMCKCGRNSRLHQCNDLSCIRQDQCLLKSAMIYDHGTKFTMGCNRCICFESEPLCTTRYCVSSRVESEKYTGLPCNCPAEYVPVCAINGQTYPNACTARCNRLTNSQIEPGSCMKDPCLLRPCATSERCIPYRQVCLGYKLKAGECRQYKCVKLMEVCDRQTMIEGPVCDTHNNLFPSVCHLFQRQRVLAYHGHCKAGCQMSERVCGVDGNTYRSECSAWASGVPMDYLGPCTAVGQLSHMHSQFWSCLNVTCPSRSTGSSNCVLITPPGACCPLCGNTSSSLKHDIPMFYESDSDDRSGEIRVLASPQLISEVMQVGQKGPITLSDVLEVLRLQISVVECDVFAYPSVESDLVLLIVPVTSSPTPLQVEACMTETEKLASLISSGSPVVTTFIPASVFVSAQVRVVKPFRATYNGSESTSRHNLGVFRALVLCCLATVILLRRLIDPPYL